MSNAQAPQLSILWPSVATAWWHRFSASFPLLVSGIKTSVLQHFPVQMFSLVQSFDRNPVSLFQVLVGADFFGRSRQYAFVLADEYHAVGVVATIVNVVGAVNQICGCGLTIGPQVGETRLFVAF